MWPLLKTMAPRSNFCKWIATWPKRGYREWLKPCLSHQPMPLAPNQVEFQTIIKGILRTRQSVSESDNQPLVSFIVFPCIVNAVGCILLYFIICSIVLVVFFCISLHVQWFWLHAHAWHCIFCGFGNIFMHAIVVPYDFNI